jgi:hypothetical protein
MEWSIDGTVFSHADCNTSNGTISGGGTTSIKAYANGWYRCTVTFATSASGTPKSAALYIGAYGSSGTSTTVSAWGADLETGNVASDYCRTESTSATCAADGPPTIARPSGLSLTEGCAHICAAPVATGVQSSVASVFWLSGNAANSARFVYVPLGTNNVAAYNGTSGPNLPAGLTAGVKSCVTTRWSASGNILSISANGSTSSFNTFSGFPSFDSVITIGAASAGGTTTSNATVSDIQLGASAGACN